MCVLCWTADATREALKAMFSCLRMATACFHVTKHGHVLLIFFRQTLVVHVPILRPQNPQGSASPHILGSATLSPLCQCTAT